MKILQMMVRIVATISVLTLLAVVSAQEQAAPVLSANVPFSFEVRSQGVPAAKTYGLPAGTYQFEFHLTEQSLVIRGGKTGETKVNIIAQLAGASLFQDVGLVFDIVHGHHTLSEVWIPGQGGVLINASPTKHNQERVMAVVSGATPSMSGKEVFESTCARCHGPQGKGNAAADKFFQTPVPRLDSAYVQSKTDEELKDIISHGRRQMDPVRIRQAAVQHLLYPESVDAVIKYIRTFKQP